MQYRRAKTPFVRLGIYSHDWAGIPETFADEPKCRAQRKETRSTYRAANCRALRKEMRPTYRA